MMLLHHICQHPRPTVHQPFMFHYPVFLPDRPELLCHGCSHSAHKTMCIDRTGKQAAHNPTPKRPKTAHESICNIQYDVYAAVRLCYPLSVDPMAEESKSRGNPDLRSFHDLKATLPATKIGAIVALLPEIHSLQRRGHKTRAIWECLTNDGLHMSYDLFRLYLGRARRRN